MAKITNQNEAPDFSGYFKTSEPKAESPAIQERITQNLPSHSGKRLTYLIIIFSLIAIVGALVFYSNQKPPLPPIPEGYHFVSPPGVPPNLAPNNK